MTRRPASLLLRGLAALLLFSTGNAVTPNRTGSISDGNNDTNKETVNITDSNPDPPAEPQQNRSVSAHGSRWRVLDSGRLDGGSLCAYRSLGAGDPGRLCFRYTQPDFRCSGASCRQVRSPDGRLTANILSNSSVFVQWGVSETPGHSEPGRTPGDGGPAPQDSLGQEGRAGGFRLSCWWNGSYTQFECGGVHLGSSCRDYLLSELHTNVPYRLCVRPYASGGPDRPGACVEFSLTPGGMQDIVIAMTTVGGAICVMLVIICLLVAYITENIMNPTAHTHNTQHTHRTHTHL